MPAAKPPKLLLLNGRSEGKDAAGRPVPVTPNFNRGEPDQPEWLSEEARAEWDRITPGLTRLGLLKPEDRALLVSYCEMWSQYVDALAVVREEGLIVTNVKTGMTRRHPAQAMVESLGQQLRAIGAQFGLSPASERNLSKAADAEADGEDPFAGTPTRGNVG